MAHKRPSSYSDEVDNLIRWRIEKRPQLALNTLVKTCYKNDGEEKLVIPFRDRRWYQQFDAVLKRQYRTCPKKYTHVPDDFDPHDHFYFHPKKYIDTPPQSPKEAMASKSLARRRKKEPAGVGSKQAGLDDDPIADLSSLKISDGSLDGAIDDDSDDDEASILEDPPEGVAETWTFDRRGSYDHPLKSTITLMKEVGFDKDGKEVDAILFEQDLADINKEIFSCTAFLCNDSEGDDCLGVATPVSYLRKKQDMEEIQKTSNARFGASERRLTYMKKALRRHGLKGGGMERWRIDLYKLPALEDPKQSYSSMIFNESGKKYEIEASVHVEIGDKNNNCVDLEVLGKVPITKAYLTCQVAIKGSIQDGSDIKVINNKSARERNLEALKKARDARSSQPTAPLPSGNNDQGASSFAKDLAALIRAGLDATEAVQILKQQNNIADAGQGGLANNQGDGLSDLGGGGISLDGGANSLGDGTKAPVNEVPHAVSQTSEKPTISDLLDSEDEVPPNPSIWSFGLGS